MFLIKKAFINRKEKNAVIDEGRISLSWQMESDKNDVLQTAYKIQFFDDKKKCIYETEKIAGSESINIPIRGLNLEPLQDYYYKIISWNNYGEEAESELIHFETGIIEEENWKAKWIEADMNTKSSADEFNIGEVFTYHPDYKEIADINLDPTIIFEKGIDIYNKKVRRARLYITSHGVYEAYLNGIKIGDEYLAPGFSSYDKILYYQTHDITKEIKNGENIFSVEVADGWYRSKLGLAAIGPDFGDKLALLAQIEVEYDDGEKQIIGTDDTFKAYYGKREYSDLFIGEKINNISREKKVLTVSEKEYGYENIKADKAEPIRCIEKIKPVRIITTPNGETVIDFGRNIAGIVEAKLNGKKGDIINLQHSEELDKEGNFFFNIMGKYKYQTNTFVLNGDKEEIFKPKFTYTGFRYVKIDGFNKEINKDNFTAYVLSSDLKKTGKIETSNVEINKLIENTYHSQESNFISVPTDCPQREKAGWLGDAQIFTPTAIFNMKIDNFMERWLENMRLDQYENGAVPQIVPITKGDSLFSTGMGNISCMGWSDACIIIPYYLYTYYEDINFLKDNYDMMTKWIEYVKGRCCANISNDGEEYENYIYDCDFQYGDWLVPSLCYNDGEFNPVSSGKVTGSQVATMYFAYSCELLSEICSILSREKEHEYYKNLSLKIKDSFNKKYVNENGIIEGDVQGLYVLAIMFAMSNEEITKKFADRLEEKIKENGNCLDTGFLATPILLDALNKCGKKEVLYKLLLQDKYPSWLYMIKQGATTIWESWDAVRPDGNKNITSYNHYSLGSVVNYIVREIGGLNKDRQEIGTYIIKPDFESPFEYCRVCYESPYGPIKVSWNKAEGGTLDITVPIGVKIKLILNAKITEFGSGQYSLSKFIY